MLTFTVQTVHSVCHVWIFY